MAPTQKQADAFRTIGELAEDLGVAQHILRYWETKFPQLKPLQRAGNRRYYRSVDVALARRINQLLRDDGYTIRGVQQLLSGRGIADLPRRAPSAVPEPHANTAATPAAQDCGIAVDQLSAIRDRLKAALD